MRCWVVSRITRALAGGGFCVLPAFAHSLTFTALPIFYVQEVGLPGYALDFDRDLFTGGDSG